MPWGILLWKGPSARSGLQSTTWGLGLAFVRIAYSRGQRAAGSPESWCRSGVIAAGDWVGVDSCFLPCGGCLL